MVFIDTSRDRGNSDKHNDVGSPQERVDLATACSQMSLQRILTNVKRLTIANQYNVQYKYNQREITIGHLEQMTFQRYQKTGKLLQIVNNC